MSAVRVVQLGSPMRNCTSAMRTRLVELSTSAPAARESPRRRRRSPSSSGNKAALLARFLLAQRREGAIKLRRHRVEEYRGPADLGSPASDFCSLG